MAINIDSSFYKEIDFVFHPFLAQQGSALLAATSQQQVVGKQTLVRQFTVGEAQKMQPNEHTKFVDTKYDARTIEPEAFNIPIAVDSITQIQQATLNPGDIARQAAFKCGTYIDKLIINGLSGVANTENGPKSLPGADSPLIAAAEDYDKTQTIAWNDATLSPSADPQQPVSSKAGLSTSKIVKAVSKLKGKFNFGPFICIASTYDFATLAADSRMSNVLFNTQPSFATGSLGMFHGVSAFIPSELIPSGKSRVNNAGALVAAGAGADVSYAYLYDIGQIVLGISAPLTLKTGQSPERNFADVMMYMGMYGCTRMFEESVIRIEINHSPANNATYRH